MTLYVGIYLYDEIEVLDFAGPFEVFSTASRVHARLNPDAPALFNVFTLGETPTPITARGGLEVTPKYTLSLHPKIDLLLIPGGVVSAELEKRDLISWIRTTSESATITASVCTGAFLLAKAGLLASKAATTHWEDIPDLMEMFPELEVKKETRWVDEGDVVTAAGISAGIDMSLHLVSQFDSEDLALRTARQMEYVWERT